METIEVFVLFDSDGDYGVGKCEESAVENYTDNIGDIPAGTRMIKLVVSAPLPQPIVMAGTVPAESTEGATLTVVE